MSVFGKPEKNLCNIFEKCLYGCRLINIVQAVIGFRNKGKGKWSSFTFFQKVRRSLVPTSIYKNQDILIEQSVIYTLIKQSEIIYPGH